MLPADVAWLAGLLEGEGCFTNHYDGKKNWYPRIQLLMTDFDVVERAARVMGGNNVRERPKPYYRTRYQTNSTGYSAVKVMEQVLPHMGARRTLRIRELLERYYGQRGVEAARVD